MPHDFRHEGFPGRDEGRGRWTRPSWERDRYASRDEERYSPDWDDPNAARRFEGDRSYEEGFRERFDRPRRGSHDLERGRGADYGSGQERWGRERGQERDWQSRSERNDFDPHGGYGRARYGGASQYTDRGERLGDRGRRTGLLRWDHTADESGDYFGTGSYYGAYGSQPGSHASGSPYGDRGYLGASESRWNDQREDELGDQDRGWYGGSSGSEESYGRSDYGAQSGYGRDYGQRSPSQMEYGQMGYGQDYRERFGEQRYGRDPEFGYGFAREGTQGTFRGRGPKGYERSDERLREMICERLTDDPRIDASDVNIDVRDKIVKLSGVVSDRRTKYEIEDLVERCGGVKDIDNQVRVRTASSMTQSSGTRIPTGEGTTTMSGASAETESKAGTRTAGSPKRTS